MTDRQRCRTVYTGLQQETPTVRCLLKSGEKHSALFEAARAQHATRISDVAQPQIHI